MKKTFLIIGLLVSAVFSANAQEISNNAIGLRFSGGNGLGGEISYQKSLGDSNRLEINLGLGNDFSDFKATGLYEWVWELENRFNWYAGFGGGVVTVSKTGVFAAGVIGIEYNFDAPVVISLDYRPEVGISGGLSGLNSDAALGVRYQF
ncbi:MAG: hypothetical protein ACPGTO_02555 [Polaribacter sp.]